jgi:hypothetical protein
MQPWQREFIMSVHRVQDQYTRTPFIPWGRPDRYDALVQVFARIAAVTGPGIRTTVFLTGCPLRCKACSNSQCPEGAIRTGLDGKVVEACPSRAMETVGRRQNVEEVLAVVEADAAFYARSGGRITLPYKARCVGVARDAGDDHAPGPRLPRRSTD